MSAAAVDFGLGLRPEHYEEIAASPGRVSWFEALSENYMVPGGSPLHWLDRIRRDYPMALHGVSLSIGSIDPLDLALSRRPQGARRPRPADVGLRPSLLHRPARPQHARPAAAALHRGGAGPCRRTREARAGPSRPPPRAGERVELRHLRRLRAHRVGLHRRTRPARRLRDPARRQQRLCQRLQPRVRRPRVPARHAARARAAVPSRRPHPQGQPHHRHPRPSRSCPTSGRSMPRR